jgi:ATP-dependent DNA helicase 2 subunit 2
VFILQIVAPSPGDAVAELSMSTLIHAMNNLERILLVRFVKKDGNEPRLGVMIPTFKMDEHQGLYFVQVPYADDIRDYMFSSLPGGTFTQSWIG